MIEWLLGILVGAVLILALAIVVSIYCLASLSPREDKMLNGNLKHRHGGGDDE